MAEEQTETAEPTEQSDADTEAPETPPIVALEESESASADDVVVETDAEVTEPAPEPEAELEPASEPEAPAAPISTEPVLETTAPKKKKRGWWSRG